ncbi:uncharacterized protein LOC117106002 [Anneissia japonica]|uniref:uncharacterized protein LOC117106002 n=1 Tax=Anneissia japonica TaxID=1529436 RepID=UPI001425B735|nr:uncharacterized protein LOC117106002 [Anneissia japonica]XP_033103204.1 uncharacterized protein LOC117106002 [Anneissia japonica]
MSTNRPRKGQQKSNQDGDTPRAEGKGQSGRRKLEFEHKPLHGKVFYFDLIKYKNSAKLQKDITALGGKVEEFLGKGINYVVTNRPEGRELEKRGNAGGSSAESPSVSTPSPFQQGKGSSKDVTESPCALTGEKNKSSRGKTIASRALTSQQFGTVSILTQAIQWGVQVKHLDSVLKYIKKEREKLGMSPSASQQKSKSTDRASSSRGERLSGVFLKVEDRTSHYRPISKSLDVWPRVSTDTTLGSCPYDGVAFKAKQFERSNNVGQGGNSQINNILTKEKALKPAGIRKKKDEKIKEKRRGFCECCKQRYDNLDKHLKSSEHREFVSNQNHYSALDKMIMEGPDIAAFLEDVLRYHEAQKQDALSSHQEFGGTTDPKTSMPVAKTSTKNTDTTLPSDLPGLSTSRIQKENSLRVSLPLEHALPKRLASQRSPEVINEAELDSSRVEEVYQEIWLGEPPLRSASEVDVQEFIKHRATMQKRIANTSKRKVTISSNSPKKQTINVENPLNNSQGSPSNVGKIIPNVPSTSKSQGNGDKQISTALETMAKTQRKSVKRSFEGTETVNKDGSLPKNVESSVNPRKRRKTVTEDEYEDPVFVCDIPEETNKANSSQSKQKQKKTEESCIPKRNISHREQKSPSSHEGSPFKARRGRTIRNEGNNIASGSKYIESKTTKTKSDTTSGKKCQNQSKKKKNSECLLNRVLGQNRRGNRKKGGKCGEILNRTFDATLSVEHVFSSDLGGSEFLGFQSEDIRESELDLQLRINESMGKAPLTDAALEVTCVKCDRNDNASDAHSSSQDLAIECVLHTVDNFSQGESDWDVQIDGYMSKLDDDVSRPKMENDITSFKVKNLNTKPVVDADLSPIKFVPSPVKGSRDTPNQVSHAFISEIQERRQAGYQRTPVENIFGNVRLRRRDVLFDNSTEDIENLPVALGDPITHGGMLQLQSKLKLSPGKHGKHDKKINKNHGKSPQTPVKQLPSQSSVEPRQTCPTSPGLSVRNENILIEDDNPVFVDSPSKHLPPGSKLRERTKSTESRTPRTPCKTQRFLFSTPEQKDKIWLVKSPGNLSSPPMLQLPPGTPQEEVQIIEQNYVHDETEIEIDFPKFSSPLRAGSIKTQVKHIADPQTGRPVPSPVKSIPTMDTALSSLIDLANVVPLSPIKMNVAVYVPDFAKEGFARNLFGAKKSSSAKSKRSPPTTSSAVISPKNSFMLFYDKHSSTPNSATFRARTKVISPIFSAYKKPRFSLNLLRPPKLKYVKSGRRTRKQMKEEQEDLLRRLSLSQFINNNKNNTEPQSDDPNESLDAIYDFEEEVDHTSSESSTSKRKRGKRNIEKATKTSNCSSLKKSAKKKKEVPLRSSQRKTRSSICSLQKLELSPQTLKELYSDGFFC